MLDIGRRFYPMVLLQTIIDAMAFSKLNVLHFHFSDFGAVRIESHRFPLYSAFDLRYSNRSDHITFY